MTVAVMNPPYSLKYEQTPAIKLDSRFYKYPLAPKSKADFMFLLDALARLPEDGQMAILYPHGVLFRGNTEGDIRKQLLEEGLIEAIIGLPAKLFAGT